jgi:hypothetical protein
LGFIQCFDNALTPVNIIYTKEVVCLKRLPLFFYLKVTKNCTGCEERDADGVRRLEVDVG